MTSSDIVLLATAVFGGIFTLVGLIVQSRAQIKIAQLTNRVTTAESAHTTLQAKVESDAERSAAIVQTWQKNYADAQTVIGEVSAKFSLVSRDLEVTKSKLDSVTALSEQQKAQ